MIYRKTMECCKTPDMCAPYGGCLDIQPELHAPGWPELRFYGAAKKSGCVWYYEDPHPDGSIKRRALMPYNPVAA